jgi:hypothetical protein
VGITNKLFKPLNQLKLAQSLNKDFELSFDNATIELIEVLISARVNPTLPN